MIEEIISFETAVLAKEKGFDLRATSSMYMCMGEHEGKLGNSTDCHKYICAPTQSLLQKWLREKHGIFAYLDYKNLDMIVVDYKNHEGMTMFEESMWERSQETEEEHIEILLIEALKQIKL